ncbi:MAG TPA: HNH endonuclease signature motif containing protein [Actinomycetospora sp.]|uniref:HNH endonuclease signature motif containing protein n=1 Tax=Actinomycetospora sp. TaxID=1872135 RepID=UPI002F3F20F6
MLTLTGPDGAGMWDSDVIEHVVARFGGPTDDGILDEQPEDPDDDGPADEGPEDDGPDDEGPDDEGPDDDGPDDVEPRDGAPRAPGPDSAAAEKQPAPWRVPFIPRVALRVGLATALGLDRRPGELPGRGPVTNQVAVRMAWNRPHSTFRLLLHDPDGTLDHVLTVRPPRTGQPPPHAAQRRHHVVELTAYTHELDTLTDALADPARGELPGPTPRETLVPGDALTLLGRAGRALARARGRPPEEHPARTIAEVGNRFPSVELRAWVQARDRTCRDAACTADAVGCDVDHTLAVVDGGRTEAGDLGPFCRPDHTFKHDPESGWTVHQPSPGRFEWTSPTGRLHVLEPEPYDPLPDPVPRTDPDHHHLLGLIPEPPPPAPPPGSPRRNKHGYLTQAALDTAARLRRRAREQTEPNPEDRFPEEPPF